MGQGGEVSSEQYVHFWSRGWQPEFVAQQLRARFFLGMILGTSYTCVLFYSLIDKHLCQALGKHFTSFNFPSTLWGG